MKEIIEFNINNINGLFIKVPDNAFDFYYNKSDWDINLGDINCLVYNLPLHKDINNNYKNSDYVEIGNDSLHDDLDYEILGITHKLSSENIAKLKLTYNEYINFLSHYNIVYEYDKFTGKWVILIKL